jgi:hypothetical protein
MQDESRHFVNVLDYLAIRNGSVRCMLEFSIDLSSNELQEQTIHALHCRWKLEFSSKGDQICSHLRVETKSQERSAEFRAFFAHVLKGVKARSETSIKSDL